jgi:tRNA(Arg) A34 adenosine deaminase TadA
MTEQRLNEQRERLIRRCYELASEAARNGDEPFGALLEKDGEILMTARNTIHTDRDATRHAELNLIVSASRALDPETLGASTLYTSTEPCAMCAGAIYWSGISSVVYGCSAETLGRIAGGAFVVPCREIFARSTRRVAVMGPVLEDEGARQHEEYWPQPDRGESS